MRTKEYLPGEQIEPAVALKLLPPPLPPIVTWGEMRRKPPKRPPQLIEGLLHQGCKMVLAGTSKSNKSWCLLDLALCVTCGVPWWGMQTTRARVAYINFELQKWNILDRLESLAEARPSYGKRASDVFLWNLRGFAADITDIRPRLEEALAEEDFGLVIIDPAYKLLGSRDENNNGEIANLFNELESIAQSSGAAVVVAHHFAKGDASGKEPADRMSGAGVWVRDPDSILVMTPHEEPDAFTVSTILRAMPRMPDFVVGWDHPFMTRLTELNPLALRRRGGIPKSCTDKEFMGLFGPGVMMTSKQFYDHAKDKLNLSHTSAFRYLTRAMHGGFVIHSSGFYSAK